MKKRYRIALIGGLALVVIVAIFAFLRLSGTICISKYIRDYEVVYTPNGNTFKFHHDVIGIDQFEYWSFSLSAEEVKKADADLSNQNWSRFCTDDYDLLKRLGCEEMFINSEFYVTESYICVYDNHNNAVISTQNMDTTDDWVIFIYDSHNGNYYCIHLTA